MKSMTYAGTGVDYAGGLDAFKRKCRVRAAKTSGNAKRLGVESIEASRGESVFLMQLISSNPQVSTYLGLVEEGLGTKNLVADAMFELTGVSYYDQCAQDTVAMIVNDMPTLGVLPAAVAMHLATGESQWFKNAKRSKALINGWGDACDKARCIWAGGETPTLKGIISPGASLLSGSCVGVVKNNKVIDPKNIRHGDAIVIIESNGIHANGLTMARMIGEREDSLRRRIGHFFSPKLFPFEALPNGYLTRMYDGKTYGETLLDPTHIYCGLVEDCLDEDVDIHYVINVTGHGWAKFMRAPQDFAYVIEYLPEQLPAIFSFLQRYGPVDGREAYSTFNMGAGYALYVPEADVYKVIRAAKKLGLKAFYAGHIERSDKRQVIIKPNGLVYDNLDVR
jgi:phosphoribosylformylglycinamidine cyclo-ligase